MIERADCFHDVALQAPVYQLATATQPANAAEPTPRFSGRETNYVRDIEGAVPKPVKQNGPKVRGQLM